MDRTGHRFPTALVICFVLAVSLTEPAVFAAEPYQPAGTVAGTARVGADMRRLWEDHIMYTRNLIISMAAGLSDLDVVSTRLMQNQADIGNAIKPYHGDAAGDKLAALLQIHIMRATDVLKAAKAGDAAGLADAKRAWHASADEIAVFLGSLNPDGWPVEVLKALMKTYVDTTAEGATARLKGDWAADVAAFDKVHRHSLLMAEVFSRGVTQLVPTGFEETVAVQARPPTFKVSMEDYQYRPRNLTVPAGSKVVWINNGLHPHTVTTDSAIGPASVPVRPGQAYEWTVPEDAVPGTQYFYHCRYHAERGTGTTIGQRMSGAITVK